MLYRWCQSILSSSKYMDYMRKLVIRRNKTMYKHLARTLTVFKSTYFHKISNAGTRLSTACVLSLFGNLAILFQCFSFP